jgi:hypothetical protein
MPPQGPSNKTEPQANGWTQYQKLVLTELERHELQLNNVKGDILEIKLAQNSISFDIDNLHKSITELSNIIKENSKDQKATAAKAEDQRVDIRELRLKFGWLCALIGLICGASGSTIASIFTKLLNH